MTPHELSPLTVPKADQVVAPVQCHAMRSKPLMRFRLLARFSIVGQRRDRPTCWSAYRARSERAERGASQAIGWALDRFSAAVQEVRVDHRGADVAVAEEFLDGPDVVASPDELGGEGVAQRVRRGGLGESPPAGGGRNGLLDQRLMQVVVGAA